MAGRPVVLPEPFTGEGSWDQWISHFENVAAVNTWDEAAKLLWLRARLTKRAQTAYQNFSEEAKATYGDSKKALKERFEPKCRRELYQTEFRNRRKQRTEGWADYAEDLKILIDKAFPDLQEEARDLLALSHFLGQIDDHQVAFSVKQSRPKNLDEAVAATLEMESYAQPKSTRLVSQVEQGEELISVAVTNRENSSDSLLLMMKQMMQRMEKIEGDLSSTERTSDSRRRTPPRREQWSYTQPVICRKCGQSGHYARGCATRRSTSQQQGNEIPF